MNQVSAIPFLMFHSTSQAKLSCRGIHYLAVCTQYVSLGRELGTWFAAQEEQSFQLLLAYFIDKLVNSYLLA